MIMRSHSWIRLGLLGLMNSCQSANETALEQDPTEAIQVQWFPSEAYAFSDSAMALFKDGSVRLDSGQWVELRLQFPTSGRYASEVVASASAEGSELWIEDYVDNPDGRTYNITGALRIPKGDSPATASVDGSPLRADTLHPMRIHSRKNGIQLHKATFTLLRVHRASKRIMTQSMEGSQWELVWSDEFETEMIDTSKWTYDLGNWGWGNNELQYYTEGREENARTENGSLIIEAKKNENDEAWTSARLTTRGKVAFLYGKIELRAKVPRLRGNWAAGWTLGNAYVDELSWPYCGEIDILESVGFELNDSTGDGIAHATVHTPAYYFKIGNQISSVRPVADMAGTWHTYAVEWTPTEVRGYVDDELYYLYDKNANRREWPFDEPQNLIMNLAMGGGWGGALGMDPEMSTQIFELDYVRVYEKIDP
jgi:beta-glucanase (GH16 family)